MTFALLNHLTTKPGKRDEVVQHLVESGRAFDDNAACLLYLVVSPPDEPTTIWVVDLWTTEEAHVEALRDPSLRPHIEATLPLLEGMPEQTPLEVEGGKFPSSRS
jgi:quinol monooxygenase YgiN